MQFAGLNMPSLMSRVGRGTLGQGMSKSTKDRLKVLAISIVFALLFFVTSRTGSDGVQLAHSYIAENTIDSLTLDDAQFIGYQHTEETNLYNALNLLKGTPILSINLSEVKSHIELLPWVESASVTRQLSGGLYINIVERTPFALWQENGEIWLIDANGIKITKENLSDFSSMPFIVGEGAPQHYNEFARALTNTPSLQQKISSLIRVGNRRWDVMFASGARLRLPEVSPDISLSQAWQRFADLEQEHQLLSREVSVYDMRLQDRIIITLTEKGVYAPKATGEAT